MNNQSKTKEESKENPQLVEKKGFLQPDKESHLLERGNQVRTKLSKRGFRTSNKQQVHSSITSRRAGMKL